MLEGVTVCLGLIGALVLLYTCNKPSSEEGQEEKLTQSDIIERPAYYGAAPNPAPQIDGKFIVISGDQK